MSFFSKQRSKQDTETVVAKRDVTISNEPKKRPDHVTVETDDCTWKIPLTLEEQYSLGQAYEAGTNDEAQMLKSFVESLYQATAVKLSLELTPVRPGEVHVRGQAGHSKYSDTVAYEDVGRTICEWVVKYQSRKELIADLVAAMPEDSER